jgi:hypothetical protein
MSWLDGPCHTCKLQEVPDDHRTSPQNLTAPAPLPLAHQLYSPVLVLQASMVIANLRSEPGPPPSPSPPPPPSRPPKHAHAWARAHSPPPPSSPPEPPPPPPPPPPSPSPSPPPLPPPPPSPSPSPPPPPPPLSPPPPSPLAPPPLFIYGAFVPVSMGLAGLTLAIGVWCTLRRRKRRYATVSTSDAALSTADSGAPPHKQQPRRTPNHQACAADASSGSVSGPSSLREGMCCTISGLSAGLTQCSHSLHCIRALFSLRRVHRASYRPIGECRPKRCRVRVGLLH